LPIGESYAGAKFSSAILPPEMIERIETDEKLKEFNKYWEGENDKTLVAKVAPKQYMKQGIVKSHYVVKSFRTEEGKPVYKGLPYDLVEASESIDRWALGALAFTLLTGKTLIPSTRDDDCDSGAAMHLLYSWGTKPDVLIELFKKIDDDAARDLVQQLLHREPASRPTVASLLEKHPFFHPESVSPRQISEMNQRLNDVENKLQILIKLNFETRYVLLKAIFEATEVSTPTTFIVLNKKLPDKPSPDKVKNMMDIITADGPDVKIEGDLKTYHDQVTVGMKWVQGIKSIGAKVAAGEWRAAFKTIEDGIKDLPVGGEMFLYLIDELTGEPVRADKWPIKITKPSKVVPKLLPVMQVGIRAMAIYNGVAGVAGMFGYPLPIVPEAWSKGAQESVELLKQESSVEQFGVVHAVVMDGSEVEKSVRGESLRVFVDFMKKKAGGDFAGLQRIGDPEDGTALWTTLTNPVDIEHALKQRAEQQKKEQLKHAEYIKKLAKVEVETSDAAKRAHD